MDSAHGRTTSGATCHHRLWKAHTVERRRAWHAINTFGKHTRSNYVGRVMTSPPLEYMHDRTTSSVAYHQRLGTAHTEERHRAWHDIITFGQHTRLNYVGRGKPSSPLGSTNGRTTSGVACHHHLWAAHTVERRRAWHAIIALRRHTQSKDVRHCMTSPPLDITSFGHHTRLNDVGCDMQSPP